MDVTSDEIRSSRFQGTRHVYDRREIDAFLHRTAATLEVYERKLAVTEAHVESLEKALDLAHGRARTVGDRESRIAELESALAAAQHNYESALTLIETGPEGAAHPPELDQHEVVVDARRRAEEILNEARQEAWAMRAELDQLQAESVESAALAIAAAHNDADQILRRARLAEAEILDEIATVRLEAQSALVRGLDAERSVSEADFDAADARLAEGEAAAQASLRARLEQAEDAAARAEATSQSRIQKAEERARVAEAERVGLLAELDRAAESAAAERSRLMADAEVMVAEAVAQTEADRDQILHRAQLEREQARHADSDDVARPKRDTELESLRRQVAQLRTALATIQRRFSAASKLEPAELELAAALVDLDLHDTDLLVDLTTAATASPPATDQPGSGLGNSQDHGLADPGDSADHDQVDEGDEARAEALRVKSRFAQSRPAHGKIPTPVAQNAASSNDANKKGDWRAKAAPPKVAAEADDGPDDPALGFYERRLAGLRARLDAVEGR